MRVLSLCAISFAAGVTGDKVLPLFNESEKSPELEEAFSKAYESYLAEFDTDAHSQIMTGINDGLSSYLESTAFVGAAGGPKCDAAEGHLQNPEKLSAFPGGATKRIWGLDVAKLVDKLSSKAAGAASGQGVLPGMLAMQAISTGASMVKGVTSTLVAVVPPFIPFWNKPLPCLPMVTGHNCFGAIQYPITASDFVRADTTDSQLDGVIASFPALYKRKVGTTSNAAYKACFASYMGMQCASIFPRCANPAGSVQAPSPAGRLPMCFTHCIQTLVACPGFWIDDIASQCMDVSVPPMCSISIFANFWLLPPQYTSYESSLPSGQTCPQVPASLAGVEGFSNVYDDATSNIVASAYGVAGKLPVA